MPSVHSLPHAPEQESAVAQEGSFVVAHGLPPSSAYVTIASNLPTAERSREIQATEKRVQSEFTEDRPTIVGVEDNRERSPACANNVLPQSDLIWFKEISMEDQLLVYNVLVILPLYGFIYRHVFVLCHE